MPNFIRKRDGSLVPFDAQKIANAIRKAAAPVQDTEAEQKALEIAEEASGVIELSYRHTVPTVEQVQDIVEALLIRHQLAGTAKSYILYRKQRQELRDSKTFLEEAIDAIDGYLNLNDWRVNENANMGYSLQGLNNNIAAKLSSSYWLNKVYPEHIAKAHSSGQLHLHDLGALSVYCCGWDLQDLLRQGFGGAYGKIESGPPKHFRTALGQITNFFYTLQGEAAGAQAFSNFDTLLAPFVRKDGLGYSEVKQAMQEFIFNLNVPTRVGFQTPFTNITMDVTPPSTLADEAVILGGEYQSETYGDYQAEMAMINRAFCEIMMAGDKAGRLFSFPIPTYNLTKEMDWESEKLEPLWAMTAKYGIPYFSNFINSDLRPEDSRSMCCRLRLDSTELRKRAGGLFAAAPLTGSIGVVTLNLPRAAYTSSTEDEFFQKISNLMVIAYESLEIKRKQLERFTDIGLYPYSKHYLSGIKERSGSYWTNHFSTIGIIGMHEACLNLIGKGIDSQEGKALAVRTLEYIREGLLTFQEASGNLYNLEATPGEGTTYRLASKDKKEFPGIITAGTDEVQYYTNSTHLPVDATTDIFFALEHQDDIQTLYTGGTVLHGFLGERIEDWRLARQLVRGIAENYRLPYFTLTPTFSICPVHGYLPGEHTECPYPHSDLSN